MKTFIVTKDLENTFIAATNIEWGIVCQAITKKRIETIRKDIQNDVTYLKKLEKIKNVTTYRVLISEPGIFLFLFDLKHSDFLCFISIQT
jgi:hypothetical protein